MDTEYLRGKHIYSFINIKRLHKIAKCNRSLILLASGLDAQSDNVTLFSIHKISLPFLHEMACTYRDCVIRLWIGRDDSKCRFFEFPIQNIWD